jgi:hypothetical protein
MVGPNVFDGFNLSHTTPYCYWLVQNFDSQLATEVEKTRFSEQALESCRNEFNAFRVTVNAKLDELNQSSQHWYLATQAAKKDVKNLQDEVTSLKGEIIGLQSHIDESQVVMEKLKTELAQILSSTSWRITAPLRAFNCGRLALLHWMKYSIFRVAK